MSGVISDRVSDWFEGWQSNIIYADDRAYVDVAPKDLEIEFSSVPLATSWAFCLAKELGQNDRAEWLRNSLKDQVVTGFELDPLLSGLYLLGEMLRPGAFYRLVWGTG